MARLSNSLDETKKENEKKNKRKRNGKACRKGTDECFVIDQLPPSLNVSLRDK
jgi:hypothetical protein